MHKVNKIRITGFRRLCEIDIEMRPLMVLIGANSVGKSSVLDAVSLLSASAAGNLNSTLNNIGGVADVCTRGKAGKITLEAEMDCPGFKPLKYQLEIEVKGQGYGIPFERLSQDREGEDPEPFKQIDSHGDDIKYFDKEESKIVRPNWEHNPLESSLSQVPKMFGEPEELRRTLSSVTHYHVLDVGPRALVKLP
ncbi:MAG: AAA family ATPase, partial [bacterium]|nr:AAA family ATPase [bacterium]